MVSCMKGLPNCSSIQGCLRMRRFHQRRNFCAAATPRLARFILICALCGPRSFPGLDHELEKHNRIVQAQKLIRFRWRDTRVGGHAIEMIEALRSEERRVGKEGRIAVARTE